MFSTDGGSDKAGAVSNRRARSDGIIMNSDAQKNPVGTL